MLISELGMLQLSKLRFFSMGVVAENKLLSSKEIQATPIEDTGFMDGPVTGMLSSVNAGGVDASGSSYNAGITTGNAITATWLAWSATNRLTAPDVRRGELVMIYQFGDQNKYWWSTVKDDNHFRRLETVIYGISATAKEDVALDKDNMYWFELSSHKKVMHFHTSKANGEPFAYDIQLDMGNGVFTITDDIGNTFQVNSKEHRFEFINTDKSHFDMHGENLTVTVPKTIKHICTDFLVEASNRFVVDASNTATINTTDLTTKASNSSTHTTSRMSLNGSSKVNVAGGDVDITGGDVAMLGSSSATVASPNTSIM